MSQFVRVTRIDWDIFRFRSHSKSANQVYSIIEKIRRLDLEDRDIGRR